MKFSEMNAGSRKPRGNYEVIIGDTAEKLKLEKELQSLHSVSNEYEESKKEIQVLGDEIKFLKQLTSSQQNSIQEISKSFSSDVKELEEYARLRERSKQVQKDFSELENTYARVLAERDNLDKKVIEIEQGEKLHELQVERLDIELSTLQNSNAELSNAKDSVEDQLGELDSTYKKAKKTFDRQTAQLVETEQEKTGFEIKYNTIEQEYLSSTARNEVNEQTIDTLITEGEKVDKSLSDYMDANVSLSTEVSDKTSKLTTVTKQYNELREDIGLVYKELLKAKSEASRPRYASISSIERNENFKLPRNLEAPRSPLGSGKPTLLKVRAS
jgi:chromosome segregation ATPase